MKIVIFISFVLCFSACAKMDSDTEIVGSFANSLCGYEGTITYADGRPVKDYPVLFYVGHPGATIDSATSAIKSERGLASGRTDEKGQFKLLTANRNVGTGVNSGLALLGGLKFANFDYFQSGITVNGLFQEHGSAPSAYGVVQKINVKLHEVSKLHIDSKNIKMDYDFITITGAYTSPVTGYEVAMQFSTGNRVWSYVYNSKPNVPINLTVYFTKDGKQIGSRNVRILMDKKDNYLEMN